jgi:hypothetical protein
VLKLRADDRSPLIQRTVDILLSRWKVGETPSSSRVSSTDPRESSHSIHLSREPTIEMFNPYMSLLEEDGEDDEELGVQAFLLNH